MVIWWQRREQDDRDERDARACWESVAIPAANGSDGDAEICVVVRDGIAEISSSSERDDGRERVARLVSFLRHGVARVALVSVAPGELERRTPILRNGFPPMGVVTLVDRDEIVVAGDVMLFSEYAHEPVRDYVPSAPAGVPVDCARCHLRLERGDRVKACPGCGAPSHEGVLAAEPPGRPEQLGCASYDAVCGACGCRADELVWHPEGGAVRDA